MSQAIKFKSEVDAVAASQLAEHLVSQDHPSIGIKIDLSPLRRSLAAPPSPGRLTPEEAARRDKETAQQLKEEHQAKVKAEKREKQNANKEKEKEEKGKIKKEKIKKSLPYPTNLRTSRRRRHLSRCYLTNQSL